LLTVSLSLLQPARAAKARQRNSFDGFVRIRVRFFD
jgi:hypothetical protein